MSPIKRGCDAGQSMKIQKFHNSTLEVIQMTFYPLFYFLIPHYKLLVALAVHSCLIPQREEKAMSHTYCRGIYTFHSVLI